MDSKNIFVLFLYLKKTGDMDGCLHCGKYNVIVSLNHFLAYKVKV